MYSNVSIYKDSSLTQGNNCDICALSKQFFVLILVNYVNFAVWKTIENARAFLSCAINKVAPNKIVWQSDGSHMEHKS